MKDLLQDIKRILGLNKEWRMAVIGIGNLGSALLFVQGFSEAEICKWCSFGASILPG